MSAGADLARHVSVFQEGTREWVFKDIEAWAVLPSTAANHRVFWLKGTGGLGKSVIAAQLVKHYGSDSSAESGGEAVAHTPSSPLNLAAYFFCKHDDQARNDPRRVVATLAFRLGSMLPRM